MKTWRSDLLLMFSIRFICSLVLINVLLTGSLSEIAFAFERRQEEERKTLPSTMKTHLDAFWWATSLRCVRTDA